MDSLSALRPSKRFERGGYREPRPEDRAFPRVIALPSLRTQVTHSYRDMVAYARAETSSDVERIRVSHSSTARQGVNRVSDSPMGGPRISRAAKGLLLLETVFVAGGGAAQEQPRRRGRQSRSGEREQPTRKLDSLPAPSCEYLIPDLQSSSEEQALKTKSGAVQLAAILVIVMCGLTLPALARHCPELVGRWPYGPAYAVAVSGSYAYFGSGTVLLVADVSNAAAPQVVGEVVLPGLIEGVAVSGSYAYVAGGEAGLWVIDVSTPVSPIEVGFVGIPWNPEGVAVSGSYAYVAASDYHYGGPSGSLRVIDVSTPASPIEVGFVGTPGDARGVAVSGSYAYVADGSSGLRVIDVSTPASPIEVGFVDTPGVAAMGVAVSGSYAYVVNRSGLRVIDVSTPESPIEVGFVDTPGNAEGVAVSGSYAYVADRWPSSGLRVIDVSTPASPIEVGRLEGSTSGSVAVSGSYAYIPFGYFLFVIDVSTPASPIEVRSVYLNGVTINHVAVSGGYAYVTGGLSSRRLLVIDVSTPSSPFEVGFSVTAGWPTGVAVSGEFVYVAEYSAGVEIFNACHCPGYVCPMPAPRRPTGRRMP